MQAARLPSVQLNLGTGVEISGDLGHDLSPSKLMPTACRRLRAQYLTQTSLQRWNACEPRRYLGNVSMNFADGRSGRMS